MVTLSPHQTLLKIKIETERQGDRETRRWWDGKTERHRDTETERERLVKI